MTFFSDSWSRFVAAINKELWGWNIEEEKKNISNATIQQTPQKKADWNDQCIRVCVRPDGVRARKRRRNNIVDISTGGNSQPKKKR